MEATIVDHQCPLGSLGEGYRFALYVFLFLGDRVLDRRFEFTWIALVASCFSATITSAGEAPNFILILTDDQGWSQVNEQAHPDLPEAKSNYLVTPNMSRLAKEGMRFSSGYSPAPLCTPTRRSIVCGASAARSGSEFRSAYIPADHMTIPRALKQANANYQCAHFGKWGEQMISTPEQCGYDTSDGMTGNVTGGMAAKEKEYHLDEDPKRTGTVSARAIQFMAKQSKAKKPFYVQVSYYAVHLRVELLEETLNKYKNKGTPDRGYTPAWTGMLDELDQGVGSILSAVDGLGIGENTYIVFTADNGGRGTIPQGSSSRKPTNFPLSGAKHSLLEGGIRVPFIVRGPGVEADSWCRVPVSGYDLLPTFYSLAGGKTELPGGVDGGSFASLLRDPEGGNVKRALDGLVFHRPGKYVSAIRQNDLKLMVNWTPEGKIKSRSLHDVKSDPAESKNLANANVEKADQLEKLLLEFLATVHAEKPTLPKRKKKR